jgi:hypothetical protein
VHNQTKLQHDDGIFGFLIRDYSLINMIKYMSQDTNGKSPKEINSLVIWVLHTGSAANIIFAKVFRQMQELEDKIHDATHPLCGFGGRQIVALGKITMSVTFGYVHNTRTEQIIFDIVDMEYPYNAIIGRGTLNAFKAILHPAYLCMKIPSEQGHIAVHGSQEAARRVEGSWTNSKAIHNIDEAEAYQQYKHKREKAASADQPKPMLLCEDIAEQKVLL